MVLEQGRRAARPARRGATPARAIAVERVRAVGHRPGACSADLERVLARHGVDPSLLVIEVTETAAISDMDTRQALLRGRARARLRGRAR